MDVISLENFQYIMESIKAGRASAYSSESTYVINDLVFQAQKLYKCIVNVESAEDFDPEKWEEITLISSLLPIVADNTVII